MKERGGYLIGRLSTQAILVGYPDAPATPIPNDASHYKGLEDSAADADSQIKDTREIFKIPNALGILRMVVLQQLHRVALCRRG
jgi:hypothetical protein